MDDNCSAAVPHDDRVTAGTTMIRLFLLTERMAYLPRISRRSLFLPSYFSLFSFVTCRHGDNSFTFFLFFILFQNDTLRYDIAMKQLD